MSFNEKDNGVTAGISITRPQEVHTDDKKRDLLPTIEDVDSMQSTSPALTPTISRRDEKEEHRMSFQSKDDESKTRIRQYDSDVEACLPDNSFTRRTTGPCTVWPGQQALKEQKRQEKLRRSAKWNPLRNLDKRTKLWAKIVILLLIVGVAVGVGVGISKAVGGGVFKSNNQTKPIS